jgi:hypothetical protein
MTAGASSQTVTRQPSRASANAAAIPAMPPPATSTSLIAFSVHCIADYRRCIIADDNAHSFDLPQASRLAMRQQVGQIDM